jgi:phosphate-selective porin OprO/OprP
MTTTTAPTRRFRRGLMLALLMTSVAGSGFAAKASSADAARDAKIEQMEQQMTVFQSEIDNLKAQGVSPATVAALQSQLDAFGQQLSELKNQSDTNTADIATLKQPPAGTSVTVTLPNGKPQLATADGRFTANLRSTIQFDAGRYFQTTAGPVSSDFRRSGTGDAAHARKLRDGTEFRRARVGVDGKVFGDFDYEAIYEFGGSGAEDAGHVFALDATWHPGMLKPFKIKVGAFEPIIGMEASISTGSMPLMERPSPAEVARNVAAGDSRSAVQVFGNGDLGGGGDSGISAYWMGSTAITGRTVNTLNSAQNQAIPDQLYGDQWAWIGRFAVAPFGGSTWLAHLGVNAQYVFQPQDSAGPNAAATVVAGRYATRFRDRPELRVDGTRLVDTGNIDAKDFWEVGAEGGFQFQNFYASGEYFVYQADRNINPTGLPNPQFNGFYIEGSWVITGEPRVYDKVNGAFNGPVVAYPFNPSAGTWGAWELAARYSDLNLNYRAGSPGSAPGFGAIRGGEQQIYTVGLNWYLNQTIRFMLDYQHVTVNRLNPDTSAFSAAGFNAPLGAQIGQTYDTIEVRSQLQF